jgi:hypothetical protein
MGNGGISIVNSTTGAGRIYFGDGTQSSAGRNRGQLSYYHDGDFMYFATAGTESMRIESGGDVSITDGNLKFASGHGIDFSANSNAGGMTSELLDTYEEGTYTPAISDGGSNTQTFNAQGRYVKIGRNVQVQFLLQFSGVGNSNHLKFNMPFTGLNNGSLGGGVCIWSNLPGIDGHGSVVLAVQANTATIACHHGVDSNCTLGTNSYSNKAFYGVFQYEAA